MDNLVSIHNLSITIRNHPILSNITLQLPRGQCLTLVGASGSGKSSLALAILGLLPINKGYIQFHLPRTHIAKQVQMIWQNVYSSLNPTMSVRDLIAEPLQIIGGYSKSEQLEAITHALQLVNLPESVLHSKPYKLSGGQQQRVAIAKAIVCQPALLICDEPISALDALNQSVILELFQTIKNKNNITLLFITHDMSAAYYLSDTIAVLDRGELIEYAPKEKIFSHPQHSKTQELLKSIPRFSLK